MFTTENTSGYDCAQLDELNRLLAREIEDLDPEDDLYNEMVQTASERVLASFDPPGA